MTFLLYFIIEEETGEKRHEWLARCRSVHIYALSDHIRQPELAAVGCLVEKLRARSELLANETECNLLRAK